VFGISRAGAVWCPVNPRNEAAENRDLLDFFDCSCLIFQAAFASLVAKILPDLPKLTTLVCLDGEPPGAIPFDDWIGPEAARKTCCSSWTGPKDMIITGGFNVYSAEVEQVILAHPAVQDCAVIGLPDDKWGERVTAVLQLRPGQTVTADEMRGYVKERLGSVKAPSRSRSGPTCPGPRSARSSRPTSRPS
jgi:acyl-CoA synthetase (AMP-forming)/AMP-acid ligase II